MPHPDKLNRKMYWMKYKKDHLEEIRRKDRERKRKKKIKASQITELNESPKVDCSQDVQEASQEEKGGKTN